jgi:hypothetical protein
MPINAQSQSLRVQRLAMRMLRAQFANSGTTWTPTAMQIPSARLLHRLHMRAARHALRCRDLLQLVSPTASDEEEYFNERDSLCLVERLCHACMCVTIIQCRGMSLLLRGDVVRATPASCLTSAERAIVKGLGVEIAVVMHELAR